MTTMRGLGMTDVEGDPPIAGVRARAFADISDYERLSELWIAVNMFDDLPWLPTAHNLQVDMENAEGVDPPRDVVLVELDGRVIAGSGVERVVREDLPTYDIWGAVDPAFRRRGLGTWLLRWSLAHARERASQEDPGVTVAVGSFAEDTEVGHRALITGAGYRPVRHFFLMRRAGLESVPDAPLPEGLEIRPVRDDHWRTIFDAENEAFRDHWGHREMGDAAFRATFAREELDTDLWIVAWDGDEVAGVVQNWVYPEENALLGVKRGWLEHISVRRPWRRRGLAKAITAASLVRMHDVGLDEAMLGVDSENPNGALGLYERLGFQVRSRAAAYRRPLGDGTDPADRAGPSGSGEQAPAVPHELHPRPFATDGRRRAVPGQHAHAVLQPGQPGDRRDHRLGVAAGQVDPTPRAGEQGIAAVEQAVVLGQQADRPLRVARRVQHTQADLAEADQAAFHQVHRGDRGRDVERGEQRLGVGQSTPIERVDRDVRTRVARDRGVVADVIPVAVRGQDELQRPVARRQLVGDPRERRDRGVDGDRLARARVREEVDVGGDGPDDPGQMFQG